MAKTPDVVDGEVIEVAWGNQIRDRTVQAFASIAERDSQWPTAAIGSLANIGGTLYRKVTASAWAEHAGPLYYVLDDYTSMAPAGSGFMDRGLNFPVQPLGTFLNIRTMGYAGFSTGALTSVTLSIYCNQVSSPAGGAWVTSAAPVLNVPGGTWAGIGSVSYVAQLPSGVAFGGAVRVSYAPASANCHFRVITTAEQWKW